MTGIDLIGPRFWIGLLLACAVSSWLSFASAQPAPGARSPEARMMAQTLFEEGRALVEAGKHDEACLKFAESNRLDPAVGTQFHLADCYELTHRLASAWILFVDVAAAARANDQPEREAAARKRAKALEPRLNRMVIEVSKPFEGIVVERNGTQVGRGQWGTAVPVDAGEHVVTANAQSHKPWRKTVRINGEGKTVKVTVPALEPLPIPRPRPKPKPKPAPPKRAPEPQESSDVSVRTAAALAMGVLGLVAVGIGAGAGIVAIDKASEAEKFCNEGGCFDRGLSLREDARRAAAASTVSFAVGGSALVSGLIIWLTIPEDPNSARKLPTATMAGSAFGITLHGHW
jgi:hypothetical protein